MRLKVGAAAPAFSVVDIEGRPRSLADYRGRRLLLSFYRYAACPYCNLRVHQLRARAEAWAAQGLHTLAFFQSPPERVSRIVAKGAAPFPLVADPDRRIYARYGIESSTLGFIAGFVHPKALVALGRGFMPGKMEGDKRLLPADFLIGPELTIDDAYYASNISQHIPLERIEVFAAGGARRDVRGDAGLR